MMHYHEMSLHSLVIYLYSLQSYYTQILYEMPCYVLHVYIRSLNPTMMVGTTEAGGTLELPMEEVLEDEGRPEA
jgi:hypothetical protein